MGTQSPVKGHSSPHFSAHVYCAQAAGWTNMPLGMEYVGLGPRRIVLEGTQLPSPTKKGHSSPRIFGRCLLWPNGWMDQDPTWYGGRLWPRRHCVRWEPSSTPPSKEAPQPTLFDPCLMWPNGWMDQDTTWYGGRYQPRLQWVLDRDLLLKKEAQQPLPTFRPMSIVAKRLDGSRCHLARRQASVAATLC